jgi:hypothetical protein
VVLCAGVATSGHPKAKQPVEVETTTPTSTTDLGFTGSKGIRITGALSTPTVSIVIGNFTSYFVKKFIPTSLLLPCSGTGTVSFIPAPHSATAVTATLPVTFVSPAG